MDFRWLIPLTEVSEEFSSCQDIHDFLRKVIDVAMKSQDIRERQAMLAVYVAFRDHYPSYLKDFDPVELQKLNHLMVGDPKLIKLRRIVLAKIGKVA